MDWQELFFKNDETDLQQWVLEQRLEMESIRQNLEEEQQELKRKCKKLEVEKKEFQSRAEFLKKEIQSQKELEKKRVDQENQLFNLKWKLLEEEVRGLANEKQRLEKKKNFYQKVQDHEKKNNYSSKESAIKIVNGDLFFAGVKSELALKKRYRDLIKIYHPDNVSGDTNTIKEINKEYDKLKKHLENF